jgi:hypothetical protein
MGTAQHHAVALRNLCQVAHSRRVGDIAVAQRRPRVICQSRVIRSERVLERVYANRHITGAAGVVEEC